jgi:plastocyanin
VSNRLRLLVLAPAAAVVVAIPVLAVPALAAPTAKAPPKVKVTMKDFSFVLSPKSAKKGAVTFTLRNTGEASHDIKIAGKKSKLLSAGKAGTLRVTFKKAGRYPYICTVPGHAQLGMKGVLVVRS